MKKITKIIFLALLGIVVLSSNAEALKPMNDATETFNAVESGLKNVTEKVNSVTAKVEKVKQAIKDAYNAVLDKIDAIKEKVLGKICDKVANAAEKINDKMANLNDKVNKRVGNASKKLGSKLGSLKKKKEDEHFAMMEIATSSDLLSEDDMRDPEKVAEVINELFLQYPSNDPVLQKKYRQKARLFWLDTLAEMYINTRELEKQMDDIEKMIVKLEDTQAQAADLGGDGEGALNESYITSYQAYTTMNALARLAETLSVLRAQYKAARYITTIVEPAPFEGEEEKRSDLVLPGQKEKLYAYSATNNFQFAQMSLKATDAIKNVKASATAASAEKKAVAASAVQAAAQKTKAASAEKKAAAASAVQAVAQKASAASAEKKAAAASAVQAVAQKASAVSAEKKASALSSVQAVAQKASAASAVNKASALSSVQAVAQKASAASAENKASALSAVQSVAQKAKDGGKLSLKDSLQKATQMKGAAGKEEKINPKDISSMYELDKNGRPLKLKKGKAKEPEIKTQYGGTEEMFDSLVELDGIYGEVTKTLFVHNVAQNLPTYREQFVEYHHMLERHKQAVEKVKQSDACAISYLSSYYKTPEKVWYGGNAPSDVTDYMNRKGVSGLVYKTYMLAKNLVSEDVNMDDFSKTDVSVDGDLSSDMGSALEKSEDNARNTYGESSVDEDENSKGTVPGFSSATKQEEVMQSDRIREKLAFQVGAKVAKKMAKDQYSDKPQWGTPYRRFPVWEDQKDLYNQYLLSKGMNMRSYIESLLLIDETLDLAKYMMNNINLLSDEEGTEERRDSIKSNISKLSNYVSQHRDEIEEMFDTLRPVKKVVAKRDASIEAVKTLYMVKQKTLEKKEKDLKSQLDTLGAKINEIQAKIEDLEQVKSEADSTVTQSETSAKDMAKKLAKKGKKESGTTALLLSEKVAAAANKAKAEAQLKSLNAVISVQKKARQKAEEDLADVKSKLATLYEERDEAVLKVEDEFIEPIMKAKGYSAQLSLAYDSSPKLALSRQALFANLQRKMLNNYMTGILDKFTGLKEKDATKKLLDIAQDILVGTEGGKISIKAHVLQQIDDYYSKLPPMLEKHQDSTFVSMLRINNLYSSAGHEAVVQNHKNLMYEISALDAFKDIFELNNSRLSLISGVLKIGLGKEKILAKAIELWRKAVIGSICAKNQCTTPDNVLYVAAIPNERDFVAPRAASESFLPPMREIVYFDSYDYARTPKKKRFSKMYVTRQSIIDNIEDLPDIWVDLLNRRSFVEVGYDMGSLDGESEDYVRGGVFPCKYAGFYVDTKGGKFKLYKSLPYVDAKTVPHCQEVDIVKPKPLQCGLGQGDKYLFGDRVYDFGLKCVDVEGSNDFGRGDEEPESELSQLLYYQSSKKKLRFTDEVVRAAKALEKSEKKKEKSGEYSYTPEIAISQRAQMKRNQFGDFVSIAENEETIRQSKEEMSVSIDSLRQDLINTLKEAGFAPRADLDLAYDDQYKEVKDALEHIKNSNLKAIRSGLQGVNTKGNSALNERFQSMNAMYSAMVKDSEELLALDSNSDGNSAEFIQKLISEKVNRAASKKYKDEAESEFQNEMAGGIRPYCAIYGAGDPIVPNTKIKALGKVQF